MFGESEKKKNDQRRSPLFYILAGCGGCSALLIIGCCLIAITGAGLAYVTQRSRVTDVEQKRFALDEPDTPFTLNISLENGSIEITGDEEAEQIEVSVERVGRGYNDARARSARDSIDIDYTDHLSDEGTLTINVTSGALSFSDLIPVVREVNFVVRVPPAATVNLTTTNGSIVITDIMAAETSRVTTANGTVELSESSFAEGLTLEAVNGAIELSAVAIEGHLDVETNNGVVRLVDVNASGGINARTSNGAVEFDGLLQLAEDTRYSFRTNNGAVRVRILGDPPPVHIIASTDNGSIDTNLRLTRDSRQSDREINGYYNGEVDEAPENRDTLPVLRLETDNGPISIRTR